MSIPFPLKIVKGTFSVPKQKNQKYIKAKLQRISLKSEEILQLSLYTDKQVFHKNIVDDQVNEELNELFDTYFNNVEFTTADTAYMYRRTSKGKILENKKKVVTEFVALSHNKKKNYLLPEGEVIAPLVDLGVLTPDGKIVKNKHDKYKQINRFLEIIEDSISQERHLKIIDFGCGKSYLTFVLYYYLTFVKKIQCEIIGLDLKEDVVDYCNDIAQKYNYGHLHFYKGDISKFEEKDQVDMIVTLHACDTATDYALYHAIQMRCKYIFSVPCCHHEINTSLSDKKMNVINKYGILKERFSAIITDAIRANILTYCGYKTQVMEFIDIENSPKNLLIRATFQNNKPSIQLKTEIDDMLKQLDVHQTLYDLIFQ